LLSIFLEIPLALNKPVSFFTLMEKRYELVFDNVMIKQLKQAAKNNHVKKILTKMLDKLELAGPYVGKLLDSKLHLYEIKNKSPPIRLYYRHKENEIYVFEFEMKTSDKKQKETIKKVKSKVLET